MSEEQGFEVVDKRRVSAEGAPRAEEAAETEGRSEAAGAAAESGTEAAPGAETAGAERQAEAEAPPPGTSGAQTPSGAPAPPISGLDVVVMCIGQLNEIAWSRMGLVPNPTSGTIERDLADARLVIDCISDLAARLEPVADPAMRRELQTLLSNLRLNYVQQSQRG